MQPGIASLIPKLLRLGLHWGAFLATEQRNQYAIPKLLRLGLHWGPEKLKAQIALSLIPKLLRLGLHWGWLILKLCRISGNS